MPTTRGASATTGLTGRVAEMPAEGRVFLAAAANQHQVTLTLLDADWTQNGAARDRFTAEARAARRVAPFCTARIIDAGLDDGLAYLVREYIAGPSLPEFVASQGPLRTGSLVALAVGTVTGLAAIHQAGLVHGQFGPEHVVLGASGPRVVGFGITPPYGAATPSADMLAWGRTVLFAASGRPDVGERGLAALAEPLRGLVGSCLSRDPAARPPARSVLLELLGDDAADPLAEGSRLAVRAAYRPPAAPASRPPHAAPGRSGAIWWVAGITACVLAIAVAVHVLQNQGSGSAGADRRASVAQLPAGSSGSTRSSPSEPAVAAPAGSIPGAFAGSWSGQANQQADVFTVHVKLVKGASAGSIRYSGTAFSCTGQLSLVSDSGGTLTMHQGITVGRHTCADGVVTLRPGAADSLLFKFTGAAGPAAAGTLTRS